MISAGTVCPIDGKLELKLWSKYGHERPDYKTYIKRIKDREKLIKSRKIKIKKKKLE